MKFEGNRKMSKVLSIISFSLLFFSLLMGESAFVFDITRYSWNKQVSEVEINYAVPYNLLSYKKEEGELRAPFKIDVKFENLNTEDILLDTLRRVSVIPSYEEARERNLLALGQFKVYFNPGRYRITLDLIDINTGKKITESEIFSIDSLKNNLSLSDIELASLIEEDTTDGQFTKNGVKVVPNPSGIFGEGRNMLYFYIEVYNLKDVVSPYSINYNLLDENGTLVTTIGPKEKEKRDKTDIDIGALNLIAFKPGFYSLKIEVKDGEEVASSIRDFQIHRIIESEKEEPPLFTDEEKKYYTRIEYIASAKELSYYNKLSDTGKVGFLKRFWLARDINPATPENEGLDEFINRINYVNEKYSTAFKEGYYTDRGRIHIRYGVPEEIEPHQFDIGYKPFEIWEYYSYGGYRFVFSDLEGDGGYKLVVSSTPKEPTMANWQKYVPVGPGVMHGE